MTDITVPSFVIWYLLEFVVEIDLRIDILSGSSGTNKDYDGTKTASQNDNIRLINAQIHLRIYKELLLLIDFFKY